MNPPEIEECLEECVRRSLLKYFQNLDGEKPNAIYEMVMRCVEKPMLQCVMQKANNNQTLAAELLGLNRNTLRKKLLSCGL